MLSLEECEEYYNSKPVKDFEKAQLKIAIDDFTLGYYIGFKTEFIKQCREGNIKRLTLKKKTKKNKKSKK
jgi:hypothetical protein